jgi:tRNA modification GTPase
MSVHTDDTICAIATGSGGAARGIVRVSGPDAAAIAARVFEGATGESLETLRHASVLAGRVRFDLDGSVRPLPCDLILWPTNRSYTREPVAEFHTIGSPPVLKSLLAAVCRAGARIAEPGEFTLRAFLAGRIDLTQAEAVLGVIDARGADELSSALAQLAGGLARPLHQLREELLRLLADLEAGLDFVEEDIEFVSRSELLERIQAAGESLGDIARQMESRAVASDAAQIALIGPPNVGKSSLFNALVDRCGYHPETAAQHRALVSPQRGTTRDYLTATISLDGVVCELVDTAGIDTTAHRQPRKSKNNDERVDSTDIDAAAQAHTSECRQRATIRAYCIEAANVVALGEQADPRALAAGVDCDLIILTKSDLMPSPCSGSLCCHLPVAITSSRSGSGIDYLCETIRTQLTQGAAAQSGQVVAGTADRCRDSIRLAAHSLQSAADMLRINGGNELVAVDIRTALAELGKVVGAVYTDDLLDRIFSRFCIGK